ncbi:MAG: hypothetical protein ACYTGM_12505, partial [Planctomycetota bacterium]
CDLLYGVTMQERGVSKQVSVQLEQVGADGTLNGETNGNGRGRQRPAAEATPADLEPAAAS